MISKTVNALVAHKIIGLYKGNEILRAISLSRPWLRDEQKTRYSN